jgi:hypothetical protein
MSGLGSKRSLSCVTVPGVQADVEVTAARIESAVAGREAITIKNTEYGHVQCYRSVRIIQNASGRSNDVRFNELNLSQVFGWLAQQRRW